MMKSIRHPLPSSGLVLSHAAKFYPPVPGGMETLVQSLCDGTSPGWDVRVVAAHQSRRTLEERVGSVRVERALVRWGHMASVPLCPALPLHSGESQRIASSFTSRTRWLRQLCFFERPLRGSSSGTTAIWFVPGGRLIRMAAPCNGPFTVAPIAS